MTISWENNVFVVPILREKLPDAVGEDPLFIFGRALKEIFELAMLNVPDDKPLDPHIFIKRMNKAEKAVFLYDSKDPYYIGPLVSASNAQGYGNDHQKFDSIITSKDVYAIDRNSMKIGRSKLIPAQKIERSTFLSLAEIVSQCIAPASETLKP